MNGLYYAQHTLDAFTSLPTHGIGYKILVPKRCDEYATQLYLHGYDPDDGLLFWEPKKGKNCVTFEDPEKMLEVEGESIVLILLGNTINYTWAVLPH